MPGRGTSKPTRSTLAKRMRKACEAAGLSLTHMRQVVLDIVLDLGTHPTADEVFAEAARREPGIGRATVYRALEAFARAGVLTRATHMGSAVRYDGSVEPHHHMVCIHCNRIIDFKDRRLDAVRTPDTRKYDFVVSDVQVVLRGVCADCIEIEEEEES